MGLTLNDMGNEQMYLFTERIRVSMYKTVGHCTHDKVECPGSVA